MPVVGTTITREDLLTGVEMLNRAARERNSDLLFSFQDGVMVKRGWLTIKGEVRANTRMLVGGSKRPREF